MTDLFLSHAETVMAVPKSKTSIGAPSALMVRKETSKNVKSRGQKL